MKNKWKFLAAFGTMMLMLQGLYAQYTGQVDIDPANVNFEQTDGWDVVTITGCYMETATGKPYLPVKHLHIAIPEDNTVAGIEILNIQQQELSGTYNILPVQLSPIPGEPEPVFVDPDQNIYGTDALYPTEYIYNSTSGFMSGVHIAGLLYYPLQYNPVTQKLFLTTHLEYRLVYANEDNDPVKPRRMMNNSFIKLKEEIKGFTENPTDIDIYFQLEKIDYFTGAAFVPDEFPNFNGQAVEYMIITNETLAQGFQEIADWKTQKGIPAVVRTVEWIYDYYPGVDQAEKVRNFIIDAYQNWGTQYFMLGGDSDVVPIRVAWMSHYNDGDLKPMYPLGLFIPADMYFGCLDGNWNADGDATFGEANWDRQNDGTFEEDQNQYANFDQVDRLPDVYIGRVPVEDYLVEGEPVELNRFKAKFFEYVKTSQGNENNAMVFCIAGLTGWINPVFNAFPQYVNKVKRYGNTYNNDDIRDELNGANGTFYHFACGLGHGGPTSFQAANGSLNRNDMDNLVNTDRSMILYLNHCKTMPWDYNTVAEHFINSENGGVAVIANTFLDRASGTSNNNVPFIQKLYNGNYIIGNLFKEVKIKYNSYTYCDELYRLEFFSHSMSADPAMPVWTDSPDPQNPLIVNVPASVYTGEQTILVNIDNSNIGVRVTVCLYKENEVYAVITETYNGDPIEVNCTPDTEDDILVTVTAKNYLPVETVIPVTANPGTHLYISDHTISGDENIDAGETVELNIELSNSGLTDADDVYAVLSCEYDFITIQNNQSFFGDIAAGVSVWGPDNFIFDVDATLEKDTIASFNLTVYDAGSNIFYDELYLEVKSPVVEQRSKPIIYTTNGDLIIEAEEIVKFNIDLFNNSRSLIQNVNAVLSSESDYVKSIQQSKGAYGDITSYETNTNTNEYIFEVSDDYPGQSEPIIFSLNVTSGFGQQWPFTFDLLEKPDISDIVIDFRGKLTSITLFWTTYEDVLGYNIYSSETETDGYEKLNTKAILPIAYYEDADLPELTPFYYKVSAVSVTGNESELSQPKLAWTSLAYHPDWLPITVLNENHGKFWGAPNVYDMENDGEKEIFITSGKGDQPADIGSLFGFRHDGEELYDIDENPTTVSGFANIGISMTCTPAIGDIDNDGIIEVVVATRMGEDNNDPEKYRLYVYKNIDANGDDKPDLMWDKQIRYKNFNGVVLADLNNNNNLEIIVPNQFGDTIEIFDNLGNDYPGWPVTPNENPIDKKAVSMPVVVDLDDDGDKEIIIGLEGGIYIWNSDGSDYLGQNPININIPSGGRLDCPVIAADIDNDDDFEILFMSIQDTTGYIYAIEPNGDSVTGWSSDDHNIELSIQSQEWAWPAAFICGDIDLDGNLEVVIADADTLKVWDNLGNLVLNKNIPMLQCQYLQPLIADVDGTDNECEIIIPSNDGVIHAYKLNGDPVLGWPLYLGSTTSIPLIGDIDNDLKNEIIAASGSDIYVWDSEGNANRNQWDRFRLNPYNNAVFYNACYYNQTPLVINSDETWNIDKIINRDLIVENGTLTIKGNVRFASSAKIIVKPGAELVLDGGKLINGCDNSWQGIQVWGNRDESQYCPSGQPCAQGKLTLKNGAVIENAVIAVDLWNPDHLGTTGGMVFATDAVFRNNAKSVHALQYRNFNPYYPEVEWDYFSNFENCTFEITSAYPGDVTFYKHVDLSHVRGIDFQACDFSLTDNVAGVSEWNSGIAAYDAKFSVSAICTSHQSPCPEEDYDKCTFAGFYSAVNASSDGSTTNTFHVNKAVFNNNTYGVKVNQVSNEVVLFSDFNIGENKTTDKIDCSGAAGIGIYIEKATGFAIEENNFSKYTGAPSDNYIGISIYSTQAADEVYKNYFNGLSYANYSEGQNWVTGSSWEGLAYFCNENTGNYADFYVADEKPSGIQLMQGDDEHVTGNKFSQSGATWHFYNGGNHQLLYYYCDYCANENPDDDLIYNVIEMPENFENLCPSHYENPTDSIILSAEQKLQAEQEYYDNLISYNNVKTLYDDLVDGGDTEAELLDIQSAQPDDMWALREQLLGDSPHLSQEALMEASDRTDVFPDDVLLEILSANPDELKKDTLLSYLENKEDPLPDYMIDILRQVAIGTTYKTVLQQQMARYNRNKTRAAHDIIRSILHDTISDYTELRNWFDNLGGLRADKQIIATYVEEGNFADAFTLANMLPQLYDLEGDELTEHTYYIDMLSLHDTLDQQSRNTQQLDSTEVASLVLIDDSSKGIAGAQAKSILESCYGYHFTFCPSLEGSIAYKNRVINMESFGTAYGLDITVKPNPAKQWAAFDYTLPTGVTSAIIIITDISGKTVATLSVNGKQGQKIWDTRHIVQGVYLYTLKAAGLSKSGKIIINE